MTKSSADENTLLLNETLDVVGYMYGKLAELPEEEKWDTQAKLRTAANETLYYLSLAIGNLEPTTTEYEWGSAHKHAYTLLTMYRFAGKQSFLELDPDILLRLSKIIDAVKRGTENAMQASAKKDAKEMENLRNKYALWKEARS
jgi:hypothetical protein